MTRRLVFAPDWGADPLWDYESGTMVKLESLPLSETTRDEVRRWRNDWIELASREMHADDIESGMADGRPDRPTQVEWTANEVEKEGLWQRFREELGDGWHVALVHDADGRRYVRWAPDEPYREVHEAAGRRFWDADRPPG